MTTETEARDLLRLAADTIDVGPGEPITAPVSREGRWMVPLVAAATVVAAVAIGFAVVDRDPETSPSPAPTVPAKTIPSVFAYDADSAARMLQGLGLAVARTIENGCLHAPGRAVRTEPATGSTFKPGDTVTLVVAAIGALDDCSSTFAIEKLAWTVLDFANGRGPAPTFASDSRVFLNGQVSDRERALRALAMLTAEASGDPSLVIDFSTSARCGRQFVQGLTSKNFPAGEPASWSIQSSTDDPAELCNNVTVYRLPDGAITALFVRVPSTYIVDPAPTQGPDAAAIAERFVTFAQGGVPPQFAPTVHLSFGNRSVGSVDAAGAEQRVAWDWCAIVRSHGCPLSALVVIDRAPSTTTLLEWASKPTLAGCTPVRFGNDLSEGGATQSVAIVPANPATCADDWRVAVGFNDAGQITAVDLRIYE